MYDEIIGQSGKPGTSRYIGIIADSTYNEEHLSLVWLDEHIKILRQALKEAIKVREHILECGEYC